MAPVQQRLETCLRCEAHQNGHCARHGVAIVQHLAISERLCSLWPSDADGRGHQAFTKEPRARVRGLGDTIAKATTALGIKPCGGCKKRQELLNRLVPYAAQTGEKE